MAKAFSMFNANNAFVLYCIINERKRAKIRNRYNQAPHLTKDTNGKVTASQIDTINESQEVSPLPAADLKHQPTDMHESITIQDKKKHT